LSKIRNSSAQSPQFLPISEVLVKFSVSERRQWCTGR